MRIKSPLSSPTPWSWPWAVAGLLLGGAGMCFWQAPAHWATDVLRQLSSQKVAFLDVRGTVWRGSARLALIGGDGESATALPGRLEWELRPAWFGLEAELRAKCCIEHSLNFSVLPRLGGIKISFSDSVSQWPMQLLAGLGSPWNTLQMQGQLGVTAKGLWVDWSSGSRLMGGQAQLEVTQLSSSLSTLRPIGSYRLSLQGGAESPIVLETLEGPLRLSGSGQWSANGLRFEGLATTAPEQEVVLAPVMEMIGRRDGARTTIKIGSTS